MKIYILLSFKGYSRILQTVFKLTWNVFSIRSLAKTHPIENGLLVSNDNWTLGFRPKPTLVNILSKLNVKN